MEQNLLENYIKEIRTIDLAKANIFSLLLFIPIILVYGLPFYLIWGELDFIGLFVESFKENPLFSIAIVIVLLAGIVVHELIHGATFALFAKHGFKSIKFGILLKMLTPYCHCKEPLRVKEYIVGAIMPAIILGLLPGIIAIFIGNVFLLIFAIFFTGAAAGDFMIINLIWKEDKDTMVLDHPSEAGCFIFKKI
ncbi:MULTISPECIES: DUF3267 domain-containing protein [Sphingobacterium]|uniref:DUF3267 domain-containing protein n=1 Tax=Sphingobacterium TaxID=28453 RepID=UPI00038A548A|nr:MULTISPECIES: DUF3267 domain-containing protein [Sphingobacterium]KKX48456.1 hypothetical protein L950_0220940 [Sphingobacterium sp. IITKGP-BTPF85]MCW2263187.1 hypothetical protein [Sphingobacterium kitahiroshimense]NJI74092.1 DUF3267 domain-containing protein [Sphingobacterium sp. B16(2022)]TCR11829.1 putative zincin peptidase [Sphingobacterium sp. JUb78]